MRTTRSTRFLAKPAESRWPYTHRMWGEIRNLVKEASRMVLAWVRPRESHRPTKQAIKEQLDKTLTKVIDMISKEDDILLPMVLDVFTDEEWKVIAEESKEIGYFLDKDNIVRYFSQGTERIFPRTKAVIGRRVVDCHPPTSVHIVEGIIESFRSGRKDHEDFWIKLGGKYVYIRYFAVRDLDGTFLGTLEVTQDIKPIQAIEGEKRLVTD